MATKTSIPLGTWTEVAADITAVTMLQALGSGTTLVEVIASADTPAAAAVGVRMLTGETLVSTVLEDVGAAGKIYARGLSGAAAISVT